MSGNYDIQEEWKELRLTLGIRLVKNLTSCLQLSKGFSSIVIRFIFIHSVPFQRAEQESVGIKKKAKKEADCWFSETAL